MRFDETYAGNLFIKSHQNYEESKAVLYGMPMDWTVSYRPGQRFGPARIREVSIGLEEKLGLIKDKNLNNAGKLLFSKKEPVMLKMAVFATDDKITFIDQKIVEDNIINLIDITEKYIYEHIDWKVEIGSGARKESR